VTNCIVAKQNKKVEVSILCEYDFVSFITSRTAWRTAKFKLFVQFNHKRRCYR